MSKTKRTKPPPTDPESTPANRKRLRAQVDAAFRGQPYDPDFIVDFLISQRLSLRETIAGEIMEPLIDRYDDGLNNDQMETLVWVVRHFTKDPAGEIVLTAPPPNARKHGLRVVE